MEHVESGCRHSETALLQHSRLAVTSAVHVCTCVRQAQRKVHQLLGAWLPLVIVQRTVQIVPLQRHDHEVVCTCTR